jgi:glycosyltransferase involved in cell wall biosynthesis
MSLRIAFFSWESMHSVAIGGLAPHATELAAGLQRRGHEVHLFTRMGLGQSRYDCIGGVHYHRCPFEPHPDFLSEIGRMNDSLIWHFAETEAYLGRPFDVVHGHDWLSVFSLSRSKNQYGRPAVLTIHSTEFGRCGNCLWDDPLSRRIRDIEWEGTYVADRVICVSKSLCREVQQQYGVPGDKVFPIYNGVHPRKFDGPVDVSSVRRGLAVGLDDPCVLFAGRMTWQKGPDLLLEAVPQVLRAHADTKFVFAGDGDMRAGLESRAGAIGITSATRFLGYRNGGELIGLFKSADVVCVPSRNEPFGIVILEAWSARKPVVATRIGGPEEFVHDEYNGLKVSADAESIGHGLRTLLSDREASEEMGRNGRIDAEQRFSWDQSAAETERVYLSALSPTSKREVVGVNVESNTMTSNETQVGPRPTTKARIDGTSAAIQGPTHEQIRRRAYDLFLARKGAPGDPVADWLRAEQELRAGVATPSARRDKPASPATRPRSV